MGLILNIETSSSVCSVCIANDGAVVSAKEETAHNSHARMLTVLTEKLVAEAGFRFNHLDAVAISAGPGSYTGLRIGVSVAKGLCYALGKPLIAIPTLEVVVESMLQTEHCQASYYFATIEAKRNQIYYTLFNAEGIELLPTSFTELTLDFEKLLPADAEILVGGSGAEICKDFFNNKRCRFLSATFPLAKEMAKKSEAKFLSQQIEDIAYFEPAYFQDFIPRNPKH